ncbi:DNA recombination protein RmuC [Methylotetracoccus oryzae]|uniref:DNA recombination protein RmuC n=1 Tax=Methylotetracoccus oryzae TaxID=1919059 RepID=UPI001F460E90|nr:DNA recombination protein RmuC [Methylotetracoccus oryzae]
MTFGGVAIPPLTAIAGLLLMVIAAVAAMTLIALLRQSSQLRSLADRLDRFEDSDERLGRLIRDELARNRVESAQNAREDREEVTDAIHRFNQMVLGCLNDLTERSTEQSDKLRDSMAETLRGLQGDLASRSDALRAVVHEQLGSARSDARESREEMGNALRRFGELLKEQLDSVGGLLRNQLEGVSGQFAAQLSTLSQGNEQTLDRLRRTIEERLVALQSDNQQKLEQMRQTVDEKLHHTLEQRLGESFKQVSDRLEQVHKGLGEMQVLAAGVGDLKKVLTNVKVRGTWGEVQLQQLLEQLLTSEQYDRNVATRPGSSDRVEFAIRLPGRDSERGVVWLPVDAKFPIEDYQRLMEAQEVGDSTVVEAARRSLEARIRSEARAIREKYVEPPHTTDFALLFLPIEGLYAEIMSRPGLSDVLQRDYRITVTGPTTLTAILNSLQMGFRTLAIEARSSEVWRTLGEVKTEFQRFGGILEKTRKKLDEVRSTIDQAETRTRQISRKLGQVESLPVEFGQSGSAPGPTLQAEDGNDS